MTKAILPPLIIGIAVILTAYILGNTYSQRNRSNDLINVTGLGKQDFSADLIVWRGSFSRKALELKEAYAALKNDQDRINSYLETKGIAAKDIVFSAVDINKDFSYEYDNAGKSHQVFTGYRLTQSVELSSKEVDKIEALARQITELINEGIEFNSNAPQYYYTQLAELKIKMVAAATEDARLRAEQISKNANAQLGKLRYAKMGVFQITAQHSSEAYSWGGTYNTSAKEKTATITMKLQFGVH